MNFLAHIFLSGDDELLTIGNFMADGIRGNDYLNLPLQIQKGVILHRAIDTFTDAHPIFRQSTKRLHSRYHHYSGVIVDVLYDHFLAKNWAQYCDKPLDRYVADFYDSLHRHKEILNAKTQQILPIMERENWLYSYRTTDGIAKILTQMDRRTKHISKMSYAVEELLMFYSDFESEFALFFAELQLFVASQIAADVV